MHLTSGRFPSSSCVVFVPHLTHSYTAPWNIFVACSSFTDNFRDGGAGARIFVLRSQLMGSIRVANYAPRRMMVVMMALMIFALPSPSIRITPSNNNLLPCRLSKPRVRLHPALEFLGSPLLLGI